MKTMDNFGVHRRHFTFILDLSLFSLTILILWILAFCPEQAPSQSNSTPAPFAAELGYYLPLAKMFQISQYDMKSMIQLAF